MICTDCASVDINSCTFIENTLLNGALCQMGTVGTYFSPTPPVFKLSNSFLYKTKHKVLQVGAGSTVTWVNCSLVFSDEGAGNHLDQMIVIQDKSQLIICQSDVSISPDARARVNMFSDAKMMLSTTSVQGYLVFTLNGLSLLDISNSSINYNGKFNERFMIRLRHSSRLILRNTTIHCRKSSFLFSSLSTVVVSNCGFTVNFSSKDLRLILFLNGSIKMEQSYFLLAAGNYTQKWQNVIYSLNSTVEMEKVTISKQAEAAQSDLFSWVQFDSSNVTVVSCVFKRVTVSFVPSPFTFSNMLINNTALYYYGHLFLSPTLGYVLIKSSTVRLGMAQECGRPLQSFRLANSLIFLKAPLSPVRNLLTWNSILYLGNISLNTSNKDFLDQAWNSSMLNLSQCSTKNNTISQRTILPNFAESKYTAGETTVVLDEV